MNRYVVQPEESLHRYLDEQLYAARPGDLWECRGCDWTGTALDVRDADGWCPRCDEVRPEPENPRTQVRKRSQL